MVVTNRVEPAVPVPDPIGIEGPLGGLPATSRVVAHVDTALTEDGLVQQLNRLSTLGVAFVRSR